jgi:uncharacterized protein involved in exopolysaccharide biosynthesis
MKANLLSGIVPLDTLVTVPTPTRMIRFVFVSLRWLFVTAAVFALVVLGGLCLINQVLPKVYIASVSLQLPPGSNLQPVALQSELENTMMSPDFLLSVVRDLDLEKEWAKRIYKLDGDQLPDVDALTHIEKLVKIDFSPGTNVVKITAASDISQESADIANAMADRYKTLRDLEAERSLVVGLPPIPVRIFSHAEPPKEPIKPDKSFDFIVTLIVAGFLSVMTASFVEIVFLFLRAGDRVGN